MKNLPSTQPTEQTQKTQQTLPHEQARIAKLNSYLQEEDYELSGTFQHIASMAAKIFNTPLAFVNFVDEKNIFIKASVGTQMQSTFSREIGLCSLAVLQNNTVVFENTRQEPSLAGNPVVHAEPGIQFYAGAPVKTPDGYSIGVVAIADMAPRTFSTQDKEMLEGLALLVMDELEDRQVKKTDYQQP